MERVRGRESASGMETKQNERKWTREEDVEQIHRVALDKELGQPMTFLQISNQGDTQHRGKL